MNKSGFVVFASLPHLGEVPFRDAEDDLTIEIRQSDVDNAKCGDPNNCVLAQAFRRVLGGLLQAVIVGKSVVHVLINGQSIRYGLSGKLMKAVHAFDLSKDANGKGQWSIPLGEYVIGPLPKSGLRGGRECRKGRYGGKGGRAQGLSNIMFVPSRVILARKKVA
jgi:hypothetical protein